MVAGKKSERATVYITDNYGTIPLLELRRPQYTFNEIKRALEIVGNTETEFIGGRYTEEDVINKSAGILSGIDIAKYGEAEELEKYLMSHPEEMLKFGEAAQLADFAYDKLHGGLPYRILKDDIVEGQKSKNIGKGYKIAAAVAGASLLGAGIYFANFFSNQNEPQEPKVKEPNVIDFEDDYTENPEDVGGKILTQEDLKILGSGKGIVYPVGTNVKGWSSNCVLKYYDGDGNFLYDLNDCEGALFGFVEYIPGKGAEASKMFHSPIPEENVLMMYSPKPSSGIEVKKIISPSDYGLKEIKEIKFILQQGSEKIEADKPLASLAMKMLVNNERVAGWNLGTANGNVANLEVILDKPIVNSSELSLQLFNIEIDESFNLDESEKSAPIIYIDNIRLE